MDKWCKGRLVVISVYVSNMFPWSSFELPFTIWYSCVLLLSVSSVYTGAPWRWPQITDETHSSGSVHGRTQYDGAGQLKCDSTRAETRLRLSAKWTSPFKSAGCQFSRLLAADVRALAVIMLDTPFSEVVRRVLATHSIRQFPLHFSSHASHFNWRLITPYLCE